MAGLSKSKSLASSSSKIQSDSSVASSMAEVSMVPPESPNFDSASNSAAASSDASDSGIFFSVKNDIRNSKRKNEIGKLSSKDNKYLGSSPRGPLTSYMLGVGPKLVKPQDVTPNFDRRNSIFKSGSRKDKRNKDAELYIRETPSSSSLDSASVESKHRLLNSSEPITTDRHKYKKHCEVDPFNSYYNKKLSGSKGDSNDIFTKSAAAENEKKAKELSQKINKDIPPLTLNKYNPYNPSLLVTGRKALSPVLSVSESPSPIISATIPDKSPVSENPPLTDPVIRKKSPRNSTLDNLLTTVSIPNHQSSSLTGVRSPSVSLSGYRSRSVSTSENRSPSLSLSGNPSPSISMPGNRSPSSSISGLRSPSLISSSSNTSLPLRNKESVFHFPRQVKMPTVDFRRMTPDRDQIDKSGSNSPSDILSKIQKFNSSFSSQNNSPQPSSPGSSSSNENTQVKHKKSFSLPTAYVPRKKPEFRKKSDNPDFEKEVNKVVDMLASCEKYLKDDEELEIPEEDDATSMSTRRSSITSVGSIGSNRRCRRLSSIPLEEDVENMLAIAGAEPDETKISDPSNANALFSAIASLSNVGAESEPKKKSLKSHRFSGHYEGCAPLPDVDTVDGADEIACKQVEVEENPAYDGSAEATMPVREEIDDTIFETESPSPESLAKVTLPASKIPTPSQLSETPSTSSSIIDKCMSKVKTFIKK